MSQGNGNGLPVVADECTFRVGPLVNLPSVLRSLECDPEPLIRGAGFELADFSDPDHRMPYLAFSRLLAACVEETGCEQLGLLVARKSTSSHLGIPGFLLRAAPTVKAALQSVVENLDLHDEGGSAILDIHDDYTKFGYAIQLPGVQAVEQVYDLAVAMIYQIMWALCGEEWTASTVCLSRHAPKDEAPYRRYFKTSLFFESTECAVTFPSECLSRKPPAADRLLFKHLQHEARELHALHHRELLQKLPEVLTRGLMTDQFSARAVADAFGLHERTLHRRLRAAGTSFRRELDEARRSVSEQLLAGTSLPVCDIANAMGYADSSGFIRAFQRWCGDTPSSWRKNNPIGSRRVN